MSSVVRRRAGSDSAVWRTPFALLALLTAQALSAPASAQGGISESGVDPRRQQNTSNVAAELETGQPNGLVQDETRLNDAYRPKGVELGSFLLFPELSVGESYDSNVYAMENDQKADLVTRVAPTFNLRSRFDRHMLNFSGELEQLLYKKYDDDNQLNARLDAEGRADIGSSTEVNGHVLVFRDHEDRSSPDAVAGEEPTPYNSVQSRADVKTVQGRWVYTVGGSQKTYDYEDVSTSTGTRISNDERDRTVYETTGRVAYEMFPGYFAVSQASANWRRYAQSTNAGGFDRSSDGYAGLVGIGVDVSRLVRGDFLAGYFSQDYNDPALEDPSGVSLQSVFNWTPSRMTLVVASLRREVSETSNDSASSIVRTAGSLLVRHELKRNIILSGSTRVTYDEYQGVDGETTIYEARGSVTYAFNPNVYTSADLSYGLREVEGGVASPYDQVVASVRLGLRM